MEPDLDILCEVFPSWTREDLSLLYCELHRDIDRVIDQINSGAAPQWTIKDRHGKVKIVNRCKLQHKTKTRRIFNNGPHSAKQSRGNSEPKTSDSTVAVQTNSLNARIIDEGVDEMVNTHSRAIDTDSVCTLQDEFKDMAIVHLPSIPDILNIAVYYEIVTLPAPSTVSTRVELPIVQLPSGIHANLDQNEYRGGLYEYMNEDVQSLSKLDDLFPTSVKPIRGIQRMNAFPI